MSQLLHLLNASGLALFNSLLSFVWQSSILLGGYLVADLLFVRRYSATFRYKVLFTVLLLIFVLPFANSLLTFFASPATGIPVLPSVEPTAVIEQLEFYEPEILNRSSAPIPLFEQIMDHPGALFLLGISCGWVFFFLRFLIGISAIRSWRKDSLPVTDNFTSAVLNAASSQIGFSHSIRFTRSSKVSTPVATGIKQAMVIVPEDQWQKYSVRDLEAIALHETAHLKHFDPFKLAVLELLRCILFFHPLIWIFIHHLRSLGESSADEEVLQSGAIPTAYAHLLVGLMEQHKQRRQHMNLAAALFYRKKRFYHRITAILKHNRLHSPSRKLVTALLITVALMFSFALSMPLSQVSIAEDTDLTDSQAPSRFPCDSHHISWAFGMKIDPFNHRERMHEGLDFFGDIGDPVYASAAGTVIKAEFHEAHGNHIWLQHANGYTTLYSHMEELLVSPGDEVTEGQEIGRIGSTGRSTGPHLHFGIYLNEEAVDPLTCLTTPPYIVLDQRTDPQAHDQIRQAAENHNLRILTSSTEPSL